MMASNKATICGKTSAESAIISANLPLDVNLNVKFDKIGNDEIEHEKGREYYCTCCGEHWSTQNNHFSKSMSPLYKANNGYVHICNQCRDKYYNNLVDLFNGNEEKALDRMCQIFDWLFHENPVGMSKKPSANRTRVSNFVNKLNLGQSIKYGNSYIDTIKNRYKDQKEDIINYIDDINGKTLKTKDSTIKFFGTGLGNDEDYQYLQNEYDDWTSRCECKSKTQELIFKNICFKELDILKARRKNEDTKDLDKTLQDYLDKAKLTPKQINSNVVDDSISFGQLIQKWEDEKPIPEPEDEFKDVDGIAQYIDVFFKGHLAKMMGLKNGLSNLYEKYMKKYTVEKPEYEGDEGNEALYDAIFGTDLKDE